MWQASPILNSANWQGGTQLATKNQLISSISSVEVVLSSIQYQVSTLQNAAVVSSVSGWSQFPAIQNVNIANFNLNSTLWT